MRHIQITRFWTGRRKSLFYLIFALNSRAKLNVFIITAIELVVDYSAARDDRKGPEAGVGVD